MKTYQITDVYRGKPYLLSQARFAVFASGYTLQRWPIAQYPTLTDALARAQKTEGMTEIRTMETPESRAEVVWTSYRGCTPFATAQLASEKAELSRLEESK